MKVENRVIVWCSPETRAAVRAAAGEYADRLEFVASEQEQWLAMPPHRNPRLHLLEEEVARFASPGFVATLATRPAFWPPVTLFGSDPAALAASPLLPNSRVSTSSPVGFDRAIRSCLTYWLDTNEPINLE